MKSLTSLPMRCAWTVDYLFSRNEIVYRGYDDRCRIQVSQRFVIVVCTGGNGLVTTSDGWNTVGNGGQSRDYTVTLELVSKNNFTTTSPFPPKEVSDTYKMNMGWWEPDTKCWTFLLESNESKILFENLPPHLWLHLMEFQWEDILFGLVRNGRVLIDDEMGLVKTVYSIVITSVYKPDWPLVVVCPLSLFSMWS
jgi:hypothetical protein